jgi:shikimate kinase
MPILALWGYMGAGKTKLGKKLASALELRFADLDAFIAEKSGLSPSEWIDTRGELAFRKAERMHLIELMENFDGILACGGGTPCYYDNARLMLEGARCVYLSAPPAYLASRLRGEQNKRPLIRDLSESDLTEFIAKHLFERRPFYEQAHRSLRIDSMSAAQRLSELKAEWEALIN